MLNLTDSRIGFLIQARMGSTRLPGKILMNILEKPILSHIIDRVQELDTKYLFVVITSNTKKDDIVEEYCKKNSILLYRGAEDDVLDRYYQAAKLFRLEHIVRLTGDNPLVDSSNLKKLLDEHLNDNADYSSNKSEVDSKMPIGAGAEIFSFSALERSWREGKKPHHREHVNEYILENRHLFRILRVDPVSDYSEICLNLRLTVDTVDDFHAVEKIFLLLRKNQMPVNLNNICILANKGLIP